METSMLAFATDLRDEGVGTVLDNLQNRAGVDGLTMPVAYHDARDLFDHAVLAGVCDAVSATGYASTPSRLDFDLDAYAALVPGASRLGLVLRPMPPDCRSADNLSAKVALSRERRLGCLDFYRYGFCRLDALDWIHQALA